MKRAIGIIAATSAAVLATDVAAQVPPLVPHDQITLVGFSSQAVEGNAGVLAMMDICQADFSASRMCTSGEVLNSEARYPINTSDHAWVRPVYQPVDHVYFRTGTSSVITSQATVLDASGRLSIESVGPSNSMLSCEGWTSSTEDGLTVSPAGGFYEESCGVSRPVACCKLIAVPEPSSAVGLGAGALGLAAATASKRAERENRTTTERH